MSTNQTDGPFLAAVVFGEVQSTQISEGRITRAVVDAMVERRFSTAEARDAYLLGVNDANGNQNYYPLDDDEHARICDKRLSMQRRQRSPAQSATASA